MRVSQHSGRKGNAKHNDRSFLKELPPEATQNIDRDKTGENMYYCIRKGLPFKDAELDFYRERYAASIEATNNRYKAEGHPDRCKTVEEVYNGAQTRPEELILQVGSMEDGVTPEAFRKCLTRYLLELDNWNRTTGGHMTILNVAIHNDEASPHAHIRRVWDYTDRDGLKRIGQNKALEAAGVPLPDPDKPQGRYNNRKIAFDSMMRQKWQEIAQAHGFRIETEPRPNMRHKDKADYVADKLRQNIEGLQKQRTSIRNEVQQALEVARDLRNIPEPETVSKGFGRNKREVVELEPDKFESMQRSIIALNNELQQIRQRMIAAEDREKRAQKARADLERAVGVFCDAEQRARIFFYLNASREERQRIDLLNDAKGRQRGADPEHAQGRGRHPER